MKITRVYYRHFAGFPEYEWTPGKLTLLKGKNRAGKSSLLRGLQTIIDGGHNARLIEDGFDEGIVGISFDTGDAVEKKITHEKYEIDVTKSDPLDDRTPMAWVRNVFSRFAANPTQYILEGDKKKREQWLLESLPVDVTYDELQKAVGDLSEVDPKYADMPGLNAIDKLHDLIYKHRRDHNREVDQKEKTAQSLFDEIPDNYIDEEALAKRLAEAEAEKKKLTDLLSDRLATIDVTLQDQIQKLRERANNAKNTISAESRPRIDELGEEIASIRTEQKNAGSVNASVRMAQKFHDELETLRARRQKYEFALGGLRKLRAEKLSEIPIDGLEIKDGEIYKDGLHFDDQLNTEQKIDVIMRIALLHADRQKSKIKMILLDDAEHLDAEHQAAMIKWIGDLDRDDVHFVMAMVDNTVDKLTIDTVIK